MKWWRLGLRAAVVCCAYLTWRRNSMARPPRCTAPEITQHVIHRGNNRGDLFVGERDYWVFRDCVAKALDRYHCRIHAYVLMRNHVHFLIADGDRGDGKVMQSIGTQYVRYFNDRVPRTGTLWEGRYWARPIDTLRYLLTCYRYIELNPVRAGVVWRSWCLSVPATRRTLKADATRRSHHTSPIPRLDATKRAG